MGEVFARRYELLEPVADGAMGSVWLVRDHTDGDVKAAKLLRQSDAGSLLRFMREQSTRIHHPHVVTPLSWVGEDDAVLFTMPLVRGGSVATLIGDWGPLPEAWVIAVLDQTLAGLEAVHAARVVHRDVKPANLLLEPTGRAAPHVRLTDFGIAAPMDEPRMTHAAVSLGTPGYMAPEQRAGADPDPRQDLFAVGTVGLEMLTGHRPPFEADEIPRTPLGDLLVAARSPDPAGRPPSAAALRARLSAIAPSTWQPGEVEVLDQFAGEPPPYVGTATLVLPPTPEPTSGPARPLPVRGGPAGPAVVLLALVGVLLLVLSAVLVLRG
ncbi:serine/threonine-protein kinase [Nocardioides sp. MH1]|uniref:serine/threonine-protein kinase n=1 Tax=Nocardioides sp. MH1 TaxID=3242490 RepID=UPI0035209EDC